MRFFEKLGEAWWALVDFIDDRRDTYFIRIMILTVLGIACFEITRDILNSKSQDEPSWSWSNFWLIFRLSYLAFAALMYYGFCLHDETGLIDIFRHGGFKEGAQTLGLVLLLCLTTVPLAAGFWSLLFHWPYHLLKEVILSF